MLTPRVFETPIGKHGENAEQDRLRQPRSQPYHRPSQAEMVRASLLADLHTGGYGRHESDRRES